MLKMMHDFINMYHGLHLIWSCQFTACFKGRETCFSGVQAAGMLKNKIKKNLHQLIIKEQQLVEML